MLCRTTNNSLIRGGKTVATLGEKIRLLRKQKEMTLEQLAEKTESSKGYIWELENRETKNPSAEKLRKISNILGVTPEFLLNEKKTTPSNAVIKEAFFRKFENLEDDDKEKIMHIIETWADKK
jgi:transcriptional regulator with XRE-family HTH domain